MSLAPERLLVRVLLDTGPTAEEVRDIEDLFGELDMIAVPEGHSYGGPPPTSAFLIVLNSPLAPFLDRFAELGAPGLAAFERLIRRLQAMRADRRQWGQPHGIKLEDSQSGHGVLLPSGLATKAFTALLAADLSGLDRSGPAVQLEWNVALGRWQARLTTAPGRFARPVAQREPAANMPRVRELDETQIAQLWRLAADRSRPAVTWHRAQILLASAVGRNVPTIARQLLTSPARVRAIIRDFNRDGPAVLELDYTGGEPVTPSAEQERDARAVLARPPSAYGLPGETWDVRSLGDFLLAEGIADDVDLSWLRTLLAGAGAGAGAGVGTEAETGLVPAGHPAD